MASNNTRPDRPRDSMGRFRSKASVARSKAAKKAPRDDDGRFVKKPKQQNRRL